MRCLDPYYLKYALNANKYVSSWLTWFSGNTCILIYSCYLGAWPMVVLNAFLLCMNVYGYVKWLSDE